jgi:hypothetical protein
MFVARFFKFDDLFDEISRKLREDPAVTVAHSEARFPSIRATSRRSYPDSRSMAAPQRLSLSSRRSKPRSRW